MRKAAAAVVIVFGCALTTVFARVAGGSWSVAAPAIVLLLVGPAWALAFCLVSDDGGVAGGRRTRASWLSVLPWTFLLAPLVLPNILVLGGFYRDARADNGHSWFTWDRMRPGDGDHDDHWPWAPE